MVNGKKTPQTAEDFIDYRFNELDTNIANFKTEMGKKFDDVLGKLDKTYATRDYVDAEVKDLKDEIKLLKSIVYGAVGLILTGFMLAVIKIVITR